MSKFPHPKNKCELNVAAHRRKKRIAGQIDGLSNPTPISLGVQTIPNRSARYNRTSFHAGLSGCAYPKIGLIQLT